MIGLLRNRSICVMYYMTHAFVCGKKCDCTIYSSYLHHIKVVYSKHRALQIGSCFSHRKSVIDAKSLYLCGKM